MEESFSGGVYCIRQCHNGFTAQYGFVLWKLLLGLSYGEFTYTNEFKLLSYGLHDSQSLNGHFDAQEAVMLLHAFPQASI